MHYTSWVYPCCALLAKVVLITFFELLVQKLFKKGLNFQCELHIRERGYTSAGHNENWRAEFGMGLAIACGFYEPFMSRLITIVENACNSQRVPKIATVLNSMRYIWARRFWVFELHLFVSVWHAPWLGYHQNLLSHQLARRTHPRLATTDHERWKSHMWCLWHFIKLETVLDSVLDCHPSEAIGDLFARRVRQRGTLL